MATNSGGEPLTLLLAFHNHQPDGNFDAVFRQSYEDCYRRIVEHLEAAPHVRCSLHHTGALFEWLKAHAPDYMAKLRALVERGQVELLGGGFYEPMLAVLPDRDARGQIAMMKDFCRRELGVAPDGMWLAERVWEPGLPQVLDEAGVKFTLLDDNHFRSAGQDGALRGYYATEKAGHTVALFPIEQKLRYAIPFASPEETIRTLYELRDEDTATDGKSKPRVVTYGDDGEKFGLWPGTKEWVWDKGWLREFFRLLGEHQADIRTSSFGDVMRSVPPTGRVYLPTASYEEMGEWALPSSAQARYLEVRHSLEERHELQRARAFVRGGIWQGFLGKYGEANAMHKKMVRVSGKVAAAVEKHPEREGEARQMRDDLYRAQCNCSYWHGLFGGLYLNYLRDAVYRHLLVAEAFADAQLGLPAPPWSPNVDGTRAHDVTVERCDIDGDLQDEVVISSGSLDVVVRPHEGGAVSELAYRPKTFMLSNVLARHEEGYHQKLRDFAAHGGDGDGAQPKSIHDQVKVKEPGLEKHLVYDTTPRHLFVDHFLDAGGDAGPTLDDVAANRQREHGDFVSARWEARVDEGARGTVTLTRTGSIDGRAVRATKTFAHRDGALPTLTVTWELLADGDSFDVRFAPELSLTLLDGHSQERVYESPGHDFNDEERVLTSRGAVDNATALSLVNRANGFRVDVTLDRAATIWRYPIETVSMSEAGFERTYQGSVVTALFPLTLGGGRPVRVSITLRISDI